MKKILIATAFLFGAFFAFAQNKYSNEFLSLGIGARGLKRVFEPLGVDEAGILAGQQKDFVDFHGVGGRRGAGGRSVAMPIMAMPCLLAKERTCSRSSKIRRLA